MNRLMEKKQIINELKERMNILNNHSFNLNPSSDIEISDIDFELVEESDDMIYINMSYYVDIAYEDGDTDFFVESSSLFLGMNKISSYLNKEDVLFIEQIMNYYFNLEDFDKPSGFNNMLLSHGIATGFSSFITDEEALECFSQLKKNCEEWDICCSHSSQTIGAMGVFLKGENKVVSNIDLFSKIEDGKRVIPFSFRLENGLCQQIEDYSLEKWDHTEHIVTNYMFEGFWIKEWAIENFPSSYKMMMESGLPVKVVKNRK